MNEQEIIDYLKQNKNKGVIFTFMPEDVKKWCNAHQDEFIFLICKGGNNLWIDNSQISCNGISTYSLPDNYKIKSPFKPDWQEFDIDDKGFFTCDGHQYYYREDSRFESKYYETFKGFGGWLYKSDENGKNYWTTVPQMMLNGDLYDILREDIESDRGCLPAIPIKIRFYRYKE